MGKAMSINLLNHGFKVTVWNRTLSKCDELVEHGATVGETSAAVVKKCKYTIAMLYDPSAALSVVFDNDGVLEQINGKGHIDMSSIDAETSIKIYEVVAQIMMNSLSEGLTLAERSGLNPGTFLDVLDHGAMNNSLFKLKGPTMVKNSYNPGFPLKHMQKDMRLALALGDENDVPMPVAFAANEAFKKAKNTGLGDLDFSAVQRL